MPVIKHPFRRALCAERFIVLRTTAADPETAEHGEWTAVHVDEVPEWLKDRDVMAELAAGQIAQNLEFGPEWYRVERVEWGA